MKVIVAFFAFILLIPIVLVVSGLLFLGGSAVIFRIFWDVALGVAGIALLFKLIKKIFD